MRHHQQKNEEEVGFEESSGDDSKTPLTSRMDKQTTANMTAFLNVVRQSVGAFDPFLQGNANEYTGEQQQQQTQPGKAMGNHHQQHQQQQQRRAYRDHPDVYSPTHFSATHAQIPTRRRSKSEDSHIVLPPDNATRMRCYRLNLDCAPDTTGRNEGLHHLGPIACTRQRHSWGGGAPHIGESVSEDSSAGNGTDIAVSTAKIFRGLTIGRDGTVTSRKMRGSSGPRGKADEKSRQAAKIDKAKDLVEQAVKKKKGSNTEDDSKMISLVIMGEYDDMKHLVRDGSKKLKDAEGLPDETLLSINRHRHQQDNNFGSQNPHSTRKRANGSHYSPAKARHRNPQQQVSTINSPSSASQTPKLKGHPRDTQRRTPRNGNAAGSGGRFSHVHDQCNEFPIFGGGDSDWSEALGFSKGFNSIWNCGGNGENTNGTMSPDPTNNGNTNNTGRYEGEVRDDGGAVTIKYERMGRDGSGRDMHMQMGKSSSGRKNKGGNDIVVV